MRRVAWLLPLLVGCAGAQSVSTLTATRSFMDELPHDGVAYASLDIATIREDALVRGLVEASGNELFAETLAVADSMAIGALSRGADGVLPIVVIVHGDVRLEKIEELATAWELEAARVDREGRPILRMTLSAGAFVDFVECEPGRMIVGTGIDASGACGGFPARTPSPAFTRAQRTFASMARSDVVFALDAPCDMHVLDGRSSTRAGTNEPTHLPDQRCAMSVGASFENGLGVQVGFEFEDVIRLDDYRRAMAEWLPSFGAARRASPAAFSEFVSFVERVPDRASASFSLRFTQEDVAAIVGRNVPTQGTSERRDAELHATTPMSDVFAALDARLARLAAEPRDLLRRTGDAPKGLLLYLPDADEQTDGVPEAVRALAEAATLDVLVVEPTVRLATGTFAWSESYVRDDARLHDAIARATREGLVTDATRLVLVGHGQGGAVALEIALRRPTEIAAVLTVSPHALMPLPVLEGIRRSPSGIGIAIVHAGRSRGGEYATRLEALRAVVLSSDASASDALTHVDAFDSVRAVIPSTRGLFRAGPALVGAGCEARGARACSEDVARAQTALAQAEARLRACRAGSSASCSVANIQLSYFPSVSPPLDLALRRLLAHEHCLGESPAGCAASAMSEPEFLARLTLAHLSCERGDGSACGLVGAGIEGRPIGAPASRERLRTYAERGCTLNDAASCDRLVRLAIGTDDERAAARRACALSSSDGCIALARLVEQSSDSAEADMQAIELACFRAHHGRVCSVLVGLRATSAHHLDDTALETALDLGCEALDADACYERARRYLAATEPAIASAAPFFELACDRGDARGCMGLAELHRDGRLMLDLDEATVLEARACELHDADACARFLRAEGRGEAAAFDDDERERVFAAACEAHVPAGCTHMAARAVLRTATHEPDVLLAIRFERRACVLGDTGACTRSSRLYSALGVSMP